MSKVEVIKLEQLFIDPIMNGLTRPSSSRGAGYKMVNMGELFSIDRIANIEMERVQLSKKEQEKFFLKKYDLLFARQSMVAEGAGKCSIFISDEEDVTFESHLIRVRLNKKIANPLFYYYYFNKKLEVLNCLIVQCAQAGIRGSELANFNVYYPEIKIQTRIAEILSTYDDAIENNNRRIALLEKAAQELYKEWFVRFRFPGHETAKFEGGLPEGWEVKRLNEFGRVETGKTPPMENPKNYGNEIMFIKTPNMHGNIFVISTDEYLSQEGHLTQSKKLLPPNSIMVSCIGSGGVVSINAEQAHTNQQINSIIPKDKKYTEWLFYTCKNLKSTIELFGSTGTTMTNLSKGKFERLKVLQPSKELIELFHGKTNSMLTLIKSLLYKNHNLARQRDLLLPRLMSGKTEVKNG